MTTEGEQISGSAATMRPSIHRRILQELPGAAVIVIDEGLIALAAGRALEDFDSGGIEIGTPVGELPVSDIHAFDVALRIAIAGKPATAELLVGEDRIPYSMRAVAIGTPGSSDVSVLTAWLDVRTPARSVTAYARRAADLELLGRAALGLARSATAEQARTTICRAAGEMARAPAAFLIEPDPGGEQLTVSAATGARISRDPIDRRDAGTLGRAFDHGTPYFTPDLRTDSEGCRSIAPTAALRSVFWQPIRRVTETRAVLAVAWEEVRKPPGHEGVELMELIATEAVVALERAAALERLETLAHTDTLTKLPNRRAWEETLEREIARADRSGEPLVVAMIDLDSFKQHNDRYGHVAGDRLLEDLAERWSRHLRATDTLARWGGDEFALAMPRCGRDDAGDLLARLARLMPDKHAFSAGAAEWRRGEASEQLAARTDQALYAAKRGGGARTAWADGPEQPSESAT